MDDFRVGAVPSSDPYGHREPSGRVTRKRQRHHDDETGQQDEPADIFEPLLASDDQPAADAEPIEDYYLPHDPNTEAE
jgi:hypothetical protein